MGQARHTVLVVDDDPAFRNLLAWVVRHDFIAWPASDGLQAYQKARNCQPDCVLLDMEMPVWDGLKTLAQFQEDEKLRHVPVIVLTADASRATVTAAIAAGATDYLLKTNFSPAELSEKLHRLLMTVTPAG